jgi:transposase
MFKDNASFNNSFFGDFAFGSIIERHGDHLLVLIKQWVSFKGLNELLSDCYSKEGRKAYQPEMMFRFLLIQFLYNLSDRETIEKVDTDLICRWFVGLSLDDDLPHFTRLNTFKDRLGQDRFEQLFNRLVKACREANIISDELRIIDTTDQKSKVNLAKLKQLFKKGDDDDDYIDRNSSDTGAAFGRKSSNGKRWYGYKAATLVEPNSQIVTSLETVSANTSDNNMVRPLIEKEEDQTGSDIEDLGGDKGFLGADTRAVCRERKINDYIIPRNNAINHIEGKDSIGFYIAKNKRSAVERIYADPKRKQGLGTCRYLGKTKTATQNLIIYMAHNLKRITKVIKVQVGSGILAPPGAKAVLSPFLAS